MRRLQLAVAVAMLLNLSGAFAQQSPAPPSRQASRSSAATYRISGKVVDAHTRAALARCSVQIADVKERSEARTVTTGDDGSFSFEGVPLGKYSLTAARRGYLAQSYEEHDQYSTAVAVGPGLDSENLIFELVAEAVIAGTITDEAGDPVRGAQVRLYEDQDTNGTRATQIRQNAATDDRGAYEITGLKPGNYFLVVTGHPWYAQRVQRGNSGGDAESSEMQALDVAYPTTFYPGVTDQDAATPIPIKGGERLEANFTLAPLPALRLHVSLPEGESRRGTSVMLSQSLFGQTEPAPTQMVFDANGSVEVDGILPGHYDVTINHFGGEEQKAPVAKHFEADVSGGSTELSEDNGVGEVTVTGKVTSSEGKVPSPAGISLRTRNGRRGEFGALNEAGEFTMNVQPGTYEVLGNINGMYLATVKATGAALTGRMLTVKAGDNPKLDIVADSGQAEIEGVATRNGKPASAVMVLLAPLDPKNNQVLFRRDQSDSDGTFDLQNVLPGSYRLLAIEKGWELEWANPAVLQAFLGKSIPVEVKPGDHQKQSIEVQGR